MRRTEKILALVVVIVFFTGQLVYAGSWTDSLHSASWWNRKGGDIRKLSGASRIAAGVVTLGGSEVIRNKTLIGIGKSGVMAGAKVISAAKTSYHAVGKANAFVGNKVISAAKTSYHAVGTTNTLFRGWITRSASAIGRNISNEFNTRSRLVSRTEIGSFQRLGK